MKFSELQIDIIIEKVGAALWLNQVNKGVGQSVLTTLKSFLKEGGVVEDVCPVCLGSGKNILNTYN